MMSFISDYLKRIFYSRKSYILGVMNRKKAKIPWLKIELEKLTQKFDEICVVFKTEGSKTHGFPYK